VILVSPWCHLVCSDHDDHLISFIWFDNHFPCIVIMGRFDDPASDARANSDAVCIVNHDAQIDFVEEPVIHPIFQMLAQFELKYPPFRGVLERHSEHRCGLAVQQFYTISDSRADPIKRLESEPRGHSA